jgi:VIT1/CCC1 family predicted Fe2+/Mn2+ transporter
MTTHAPTRLAPLVPAFDASLASRLNWLRAGVLGANDGIVSIAALVVGVAAASPSVTAIAIAGLAGLVAGALSMASGEYVSVSSQRDAERVAAERARAAGEHGPAHLTSAWHAALASLASFVVGGIIPMSVVLLTPEPARVLATFASVVLALALTGVVSARLGGSPAGRAAMRNVVGGGLAMLVTYGIGNLVGMAI